LVLRCVRQAAEEKEIALRKTAFLLLATLILSGCATYKFQKSTSGPQGYLACYDGTPIVEYTVGKEKSLPDLALAKERFKRRRPTVEYYYKQMGRIETRLKEFLWDPPVMAIQALGGVLGWPFIAVADYKYNHNPEYKARVDRLEEEKETLEAARAVNLRKKLDAYIVEDLSKESFPLPQPQGEAKVLASVLPAVQEAVPKAETLSVSPEKTSVPSTPLSVIKEEPALNLPAETAAAAGPAEEIQPVIAEAAPVVKAVLEPPVAVIIAQPSKGSSPLKVNFSGSKSHSKSGKIVSYLWDFGDGDTSTLKNPTNTYWSTTFGSRSFNVTLTARDQAGSVSTAASTIEVTTH